MTKEIQILVEKFEHFRESRQPVIESFNRGERPFLVVASPISYDAFFKCNSVEESFESNIRDFSINIEQPSDSLPFLEPWFGVGAYAEAFGAEYVWSPDTAPQSHPRWKSYDEHILLSDVDPYNARILKMILKGIRVLKERTGERLPIAVTDTQSAHDTATLLIDTCSVLEACYTNPDHLKSTLERINRLIIDFTRIQMEEIGPELLVRPGHIMSNSLAGGPWISVSDDNLIMNSADVNREFLLPYTDEIGRQFGGVAVHSCGNWAHTMPVLREFEHIRMIDCALEGESDPSPNKPEKVRDALTGTGIIVQARVGEDMEQADEVIRRLFSPGLRLILKIPTPDRPRERYDHYVRLLESLYG